MTLRHTSSWRSIISLCSLGLLLAAGCDDTDATIDAATDSGVVLDTGSTPTDSGTQPTDSGTQPTDTGTTPVDAGTQPTDSGTTPTDSGTTPADAGTPAATPQRVPVSATGHDRFFGVTYEPGGSFYAVGVVSNSNVAATADFETVVAKFTSAGTLDTTFGTGGFARRNLAVGLGGEVARGIVVQSTGKIVVAATIEHVATGADVRDRDVALIRFNTDGTVDSTFGTAGVVTLDLSAGEVVGSSYVADSAWGLSNYPGDRLVLSGSQKRSGATDSDFVIVRLTTDGARDATFGTNGVASVDINNRNASARGLTVLADGTILGGGYMDEGGVTNPVVFKLTAAGVLDTTFNTTGIFSRTVLAAATEVYSTIAQGTSIVTVGYGRGATTDAGVPSLDIISLRLSAAGALDTTYGNTGATGAAQVDFMGQNDQARALVGLPDGRSLYVGGARPTAPNVDGMLGVLTANGMPDATFGTNGIRTFDFGGVGDFFWGAAVNPARTRVAVVGLRGVAVPAADAGVSAENDDGVVYLLPL